jgi:hypothetical protein
VNRSANVVFLIFFAMKKKEKIILLLTYGEYVCLW